jgi:hypothetical protein
MELKKDSIWEFFDDTPSFEEFQKNVLETIFLKQQVPDNIKSEISVIEKLLLHSYYEYDFIDLALSQAVFTLEKCIRIRYTATTGKANKKLLLSELIDWCFENNYFETQNKEILTQLRGIRNSKVHNEEPSKGGLAYLKKVYSVFHLINDLYEDPSLRILRREKIRKLQTNLNELLKNGLIINYKGKRSIIFKVDVIFFNNKHESNTVSLVIWPIFDIEPYRNNKYRKPYSFDIEVTNLIFDKDYLRCHDITNGKEIILERITDETNTNRFTKWREGLIAFENMNSVLYLTTDLNNNFYSALKRFHQL